MTNSLALEELASRPREMPSSVAKDIPGDSDARSDAVIVLLNKGIVRTRRAV